MKILMTSIFGSEQRRNNLTVLKKKSSMRELDKRPLERQVAGNHYRKYKIQPVEYAMANNLNYCQANAIKYITRYADKNGIEDLHKAIHNIEILIELIENGELDDNDGIK